MRRSRRPRAALRRLTNHLVDRLRKPGVAVQWVGLEPLEERRMLSSQISVLGGPFSNTTGDATVAIPAGDVTPSTSDHTDAGSVDLGDTTSWQFEIKNTGTTTLNLASTVANILNISGANAADFTVDTTNSSPPTTTVAPGGSTTFTLDFTPTVAGVETATVAIQSDDPNTPVYTFAIKGTGIPKPLSGASEDTDFQIPYATLNAAIQTGTTPPTPMYQVQTVDSGTLTDNGVAVTAGSTIINPGDTLVWHPAANADRTLDAFTVKTWNGTATTGTPIEVRVEVTPVNEPPVGTLTNSPVVQVGASPTTINLNNMFSDPDIGTDPVVQFNTTLGSFDVNLFNTLTPATVNNFLNYVNNGEYDNTFFHRLVSSFVLQGGGYPTASGDPSHITTTGTVNNEFNDQNLVGTIAMAKVGNDPNSASSEWFFNLGNNSDNLDNQNGGFTVFGEVIGNGMSVINTIASLQTLAVDQNALSAVPVLSTSNGAVASNYINISSITPVPALTYAIASNSNPGLVSTAINNTTGQLILSYAPGMSGSATIDLTVTDLTGNTITAPFTVRVNTPPTAGNFNVTTTVNHALPIALLSGQTSDADGTINPASVAIVTQPAHGTLSLDPATGIETFNPTAGFTGNDSFTYTVADNTGAVSAPATVTVHVAAAPVANPDTAFAEPSHPVTISVLANDTAETTNNNSLVPSTVALVSGQGPSQGTAVANSDGTITYTPNAGFTGSDTFEYTVKDANGSTSNAATVTVEGESLTITIGTGNAKSVTFTNSGNTTTTVTMSGGVATLHFAGAGLTSTTKGSSVTITGGEAQLVDVELTDTTAAGALAFSGKGNISINTINSTGGLKSIIGSMVDLTGSLNVAGDLATLTLHNVDDATISLPQADTTGNMAVTIAAATDMKLNSGIKIKSLTAASITGNQSEITAPVLSALTVNGALDANLTLAGSAGVATTLGAVNAKGGITGGTWNITGNASTITTTTSAAGWDATITGDAAGLKFSGDADGDFTARSLKSLTTSGNLDLDLTLTGGNGSPTPTLGTVSVKDAIEGNWIITGNASTVSAASSDPAWVAAITGSLPTLKFTGNASGTITAQSITTFSVGGTLTNADITLTQAANAASPKTLALGSLTVKGLANNVNLASAGNVGTLTLAAIDNSNFFAGVEPGTAILPQTSGNFLPAPNQATIQTVKLTGLKSQAFDMVNSNIAAWTLGAVTLVSAEANSGEGASGIAANLIKSLMYTDTNPDGTKSTTKLTTPAKFQGVTNVGPLIVNIIPTPAS